VSAKKTDSTRFREIRNSQARRRYLVEERFEAGIALVGTEVKSIRGGHAQIGEAYVRVEGGQAHLCGAHIAEYSHGNVNNHDPYRTRPLLLNKREIRTLEHGVRNGGRAVIPLRMYFKKGLIKVEVALCTAKKLADRREALKKKAELREADRAMKNRHF
jgi:SsrA-binding protein